MSLLPPFRNNANGKENDKTRPHPGLGKARRQVKDVEQYEMAEAGRAARSAESVYARASDPGPR